MALTSDASLDTDVKRRVLVSADSHGGAPPGELEKVLARMQRTDGKQVRILENGAKKNPEVHPEDRIREQEIDGVVAEVIYGSTGFTGDDLAAAVTSCQATNDWSAEMYGPHLGRFAPSISLPIPIEPYGGNPPAVKPEAEHIAAAAAELGRAAGLGLRPGLMPDTLDALPYNRPDWNPVWEAACELDVPLSFHVGIGHNPVQAHGPGGAITTYTIVTSQIIGTLSHLTAGGVLETFPQLKVVLTECGSGWLAWAMHIMDEAYVKHAHWVKPKLPMPPSEYVKRQVQVTFQDDLVGVANRHITGLRCLMWGSDYPHHEGTWPNSQEAVVRQFAGVPEDEVDQICRRNAIETFKFTV